MRSTFLCISLIAALPVLASNEQQEIHRLEKKTNVLQQQLKQLKNKVSKSTQAKKKFHNAPLTIHHPDHYHGFYPTALVADNAVITYIAGTPVVSSPYLGSRPSFDGSDYIVNISSINRDIRLMQQRRRLYDAYRSLGYAGPQRPIIAISGKAEPVFSINQPYIGDATNDITLGSSELDVAVTLNENVEAFMSIAYDESPPLLGGQRISNSAVSLNQGFVNIGNLEKTPFYLTAGQMYVPFGRYSSSMVSSPLTLMLARTKARPVIVGYQSQTDSGPYAAAYTFVSDTNYGGSNTGGFNLGYQFRKGRAFGDIGVGLIGTAADAQGMQNTGSIPNTTFGGFGSINNGSEYIRKTPALDVHGNISFDKYSLTAEWVGVTEAFPEHDLSFNGRAAKPQAVQLEAGVTFKMFERPSSFALGYQWTDDALALNLPKRRISAVFNISIWKDTVESLEYRHDSDYGQYEYANGAFAPGFINQNTLGTGHNSDTVVAQLGVYF